MAVQAISNSILSRSGYLDPANENLLKSSDNKLRQLPRTTHASVSAETEYLTAQRYAVEFTSKDGDKVTFSYESVEYGKAVVSADLSGNDKSIKDLVKYVKDMMGDLKKDLLKSIIKKDGGEVQENSDVPQENELKIPEYWNAENTSQRIVDFATSFFNVFKGQGKEFLDSIKGAIEKGFSDARDTLGELPDQVSRLIGNTHDLVIKKLDEWAKNNGIIQSEEKEVKDEPING
jgi:hypothetical protein